MRYVRFLKTPRIVHDKNRPSAHVFCLITITSDLGDSFLPFSITLCAELIQNARFAGISDSESNSEDQISDSEILDITDNVLTWKTIQWNEEMRSLPVTLPLSRNYKKNGPLIVRIGVEPKSKADEFDKLLQKDSRGVVSVWSAPFNLEDGSPVSRTVERRFRVGTRTHRILEETGESIARHLWDAGVTLSCHLPYLLDRSGIFDKAFEQVRQRQEHVRLEYPAENLELDPEQQKMKRFLEVVELGTGCGMVGIALSHLISYGEIWLTDLSEAREIVERNARRANRNRKNQIRMGFSEHDWEKPLHQGKWPIFGKLEPKGYEDDGPTDVNGVDLVVAADCIYNADSSPALVNTIQQIATRSPHVTVVIAMKRRHESESVFFELMSKAKFETVNTICFPLPGDEKAGEENVELYIYEYFGESVGRVPLPANK